MRQSCFERYPKITLFIVAVLLVVGTDWLVGKAIIPEIPSAYNPHYHHDYKPFVHARRGWGNLKYWMVTDSLGFKDYDTRQVPLSDSRHRILFLGDSFTEGIGYQYDETFVGIFAAALGRDKYDVLNAAMIAYSPKIYYLKLKYLLENVGLKVDEVIVFIDISDIQDEVVYDYTIPMHHDWKTGFMKTYVDLKQTSALVYLLDKAGFRPEALTVSKNMSKAENTDDSGQADLPELVKRWRKNEHSYYLSRPHWMDNDQEFRAWGKRGMFLAESNMDKLYRLCGKYNLKLTIAVYPWPDFVDEKFLESKQVSYWREFAQVRRIPFLNLFPDFISAGPHADVKKKYYIQGDGHWNGEGHKFVAAKLLDFWRRENKTAR